MVKLFSKNSNLCDHQLDNSTLRTDRRRDRRTDNLLQQYRAMLRRIAR